MKGALFVLLVLLVVSSNGFSQHHENVEHEQHFHANHFGVLAGATTKLEKEGTHLTLGVDYVRKFPPDGRWGISVFGEVIFEEHTEWLFGLPAYYYLNKNIWIRTGPAIEFFQTGNKQHSENTASSSGHDQTENKTKFIWRIGFGYEFGFGALSLTPSVDLDLARSTTSIIWGINLGKGF
jgi:hypothetical protein